MWYVGEGRERTQGRGVLACTQALEVFGRRSQSGSDSWLCGGRVRGFPAQRRTIPINGPQGEWRDLLYVGQSSFHDCGTGFTSAVSFVSSAKTTARPACKCQSIWQCRNHGPGLSVCVAPDAYDQRPLHMSIDHRMASWDVPRSGW